MQVIAREIQGFVDNLMLLLIKDTHFIGFFKNSMVIRV
tara:strand:- start:1128 stop:1241 length:114 start_codon:yes stop_codon:yes gene_type:complete